MLRKLIQTVTLSVLIGSFIFLVSLMIFDPSKEIVSVWIASALIGVVSTLHYTELSSLLAMIFQVITGAVAFSIVALINGWITPSVTDVLIYAGTMAIIIIAIQSIFFMMSFVDSKKINEKLTKNE